MALQLIFLALVLTFHASAQSTCPCNVIADPGTSCVQFTSGNLCEPVQCSDALACVSESSTTCEISLESRSVIRRDEGSSPLTCTVQSLSDAQTVSVAPGELPFDVSLAVVGYSQDAAQTTNFVDFAKGGDSCFLSGFLFYDGILTGVPTAAYLYGPATPGSNASVLYALFDTPDVAQDFYDSQFISFFSESLEMSVCDNLNAGLTYIDYLTTANPTGESRSQLQYVTFYAMEVVATGQEVGELDGYMELDMNGNKQVCINGSVSPTNTPTNLQLHMPAASGSEGPVAIDLFGDLSLDGSIYTIDACYPLTSAEYGWLRDGLSYMLLSTDVNPTGEARGQGSPNSGFGLRAAIPMEGIRSVSRGEMSTKAFQETFRAKLASMRRK